MPDSGIYCPIRAGLCEMVEGGRYKSKIRCQKWRGFNVEHQ